MCMNNPGEPLKLVSGERVYLMPGIHSSLQVTIVEQFGPRYTAGAAVLLLGDVINKFVIFERQRLERLGVPVTLSSMLADIILYQEEKNWLYLIKVGTALRFMSHRRKQELEKLLERCTAEIVYVSVFPNFAAYQRYAMHVAWGSHVWIAEIPEHMIHYNGNLFLIE